MTPQILPYAIPLYLSVAVSCFIMYYACRRYAMPGALPLIALSLCIAHWSLCVSLSFFYHDLSTLILLSNIQSVSIALIPTIWLIFALQYSRLEIWITWKTLAWLAVEPILFEILLWTDDRHHLMRVENWLDTASWPFPVHLSTFGIGYWGHVVYCYILTVVACVILIRELIRSYHMLYRWQVIALILAMAIPWAANIVQLAKLGPLPNMMVTPLSFGLSNMALAWGVLRHRLLDIVPIAREVVLDSMRDGVVVLDIHGRIADLNPMAQRLIHRDSAHLIGRMATEALPEWSEVLQTPMHEEMIKTIRDDLSGDVLRQIDVHISPLYNRRQTIAGRLIVIQDTTDRRQAEEERLKISKLESIGLLAGGIAHDFNNNLTGILGYLSFARLDLDPDHPVYERIEMAEEAAMHARTLTAQLLAFARGGAPIKEVMALEAVITSAVTFILSGSNARCSYSIPDNLWPAAIDPGQITQVIQNLVINADQAMPDGGAITIRCSNEVIDSGAAVRGMSLVPGFYVKISISDEGVGIPEHQISKIFDPYYTTKPTGTGLGLTTSHTIVKRHDGAMTVSSVEGKGTTFDVYLPASTEADEAALHPHSGGDAGSVSFKGNGRGRILIMDDEPQIRRLSEQGLGRQGYTVTCASHGAEALEMFKQAMLEEDPFDVVIMDLTVPGGMGGQKTMERLRAIDPDVKAIVSSGYSNDPVMANFEQYGFQARVAKPYRLNDLVNAVARLLHNGANPEASPP